MTATLQVPSNMPVGLDRACLNGQAADATPVEQIERAIAHMLGRRRHTIPLWCHPRIVTTGPQVYNLRVRRQSWTAGATLYLTYATISPWDYWTLAVGGDVAAAQVIVPPSPDNSVGGAEEVALRFTLGDGSAQAVADVNITLTLTFARRDPVVDLLLARAITLYSAFLATDPSTEITG